MARATVLEYRANTDQAERELRDLEQRTRSLATQSNAAGAAAGAGAGGIARMAAAAGPAALAIGGIAAALAGTVKGLAAFGNELERRLGVMNRFTGDVSEAIERTNGLVSEFDAMQTAARAQEAGLNLTARQLANVTVAVERYKAATGDAAATADQFIDAIAQGRTFTLKRYGIVMEEVTDQTEAQQMALDLLEQKFGAAEVSADTMGGTLSVLGNFIDDVTTDLYKSVDALETVDVGLTNIVPSLDDLRLAFRKSFAGIVGTMNAASRHVEHVLDLLRLSIAKTGQAIRALMERDVDAAANAANDAAQAAMQALTGGVLDFGTLLNDEVDKVFASIGTRGGGGENLREFDTRDPRNTRGGKGGKQRGESGDDVDVTLDDVEREQDLEEFERRRALEEEIQALQRRGIEERARAAGELAEMELRVRDTREAVLEAERAVRNAPDTLGRQRAELELDLAKQEAQRAILDLLTAQKDARDELARKAREEAEAEERRLDRLRQQMEQQVRSSEALQSAQSASVGIVDALIDADGRRAQAAEDVRRAQEEVERARLGTLDELRAAEERLAEAERRRRSVDVGSQIKEALKQEAIRITMRSVGKGVETVGDAIKAASTPGMQGQAGGYAAAAVKYFSVAAVFGGLAAGIGASQRADSGAARASGVGSLPRESAAPRASLGSGAPVSVRIEYNDPITQAEIGRRNQRSARELERRLGR